MESEFAAGGVIGDISWSRVVVIVSQDGNGCRCDCWTGQTGDIAQDVAESGLDEGVAVEIEVGVPESITVE